MMGWNLSSTNKFSPHLPLVDTKVERNDNIIEIDNISKNKSPRVVAALASV